MITSETIGNLALALAGAQAELKNPAKDKMAVIPNKNGGAGFKYAYSDFATALDGIRVVLAKHKIAFLQGTEWTGQIIMLKTRLVHESGEWIQSEYPVGGMGDHRTMGSALSYARRYAFFSLIGVQGEDDDDGEQAQNQPPPQPQAKIQTDVESVVDTYIHKMQSAETFAAFEEEVKKARAAFSRFSTSEKAKISSVVEARRAFWSQAPQEAS